MEDLFEEISLNWSYHFCSWGFQYKGQPYMHIVRTNGTTNAAQIKVIENMVKVMKRLKGERN